MDLEASFKTLIAECRATAETCRAAAKVNDIAKWRAAQPLLTVRSATLAAALSSAGAEAVATVPIEDIVALTRLMTEVCAFKEVVHLGNALHELGINNGRMRKIHAQALVDTGDLDAATALLDRLKVDEDSEYKAAMHRYASGKPDTATATRNLKDAKAQYLDVIAARGRVAKQRYVTMECKEPGEPCRTLMLEAIAAYREAYAKGDPGRRYYPGVNLIALIARARKDGIALSDVPAMEVLAREIIADIRVNPDAANDPWAEATLGEVYLALGDIERSAHHFGRYMAHPSLTQFQLAGTERNLWQIWGMRAEPEGRGQILLAMRVRLLAMDGASVKFTAKERAALARVEGSNYGKLTQRMLEASGKAVAVGASVAGGAAGATGEGAVAPAAAMAERRISNSAGFIDIGSLFRHFECGKGVARVSSADSPVTFGTGFLLRGGDLCPSLADTLCVLTNSHVVSGRGAGTLTPSRTRITFDAEHSRGARTEYGCELIWESPPEEHDAALLRLVPQPTASPFLRPLELASDEIPLVHERTRSQQQEATGLVIIGHPLGGHLSLSRDDRSILLDLGHKPPRSHITYLHYRTPTEPGNSGSPVIEFGNFRVIGLHRAGPDSDGGVIPSLNGHPDPIQANEGVHIASIRAAIRAARTAGGPDCGPSAPSPTPAGEPLPPKVAATQPSSQFAVATTAPAASGLPQSAPKGPLHRLAYHELIARLNDPEQPKEALAPYFKAVPSGACGPFRPQLELNPDLVDLPSEESRTQLLLLANAASVLRRQQLWRRRVSEGYDGLRIVAEGDSWFEFPILLDDVVDQLNRNVAVFSIAAAGDTIADMAGEANFRNQVMPALDEVKPQAFLISGGGNDMVGDGLKACLADFAPGRARRAGDYLTPKLEENLARIRESYVSLFSRLLRANPQLKIFTHGYDLATPRLEGGEWLGAPFASKGFKDSGLCREIIDLMLKRFAGMHAGLEERFKGSVHFVNLMGVVGSADWHDELHPTDAGFARVADRFRERIESVFSQRSA